MNILYDYSIFQLQNYGGISRYFHQLINHLSLKRDVNVNLFEGFHINEYDFSKDKNNLGFYLGYKVRTIPGYGLSFGTLNKIWFNRVYSEFPNLDIFHPTYYRYDLHKFKKSAVVITVYDLIYELYGSNFKDREIVLRSKKTSIEASDIIISISEHTKEDLIRIYDIPKEKVKVVYLANSLKPHDTLEPNGLILKPQINEPYILYVGVRKGYKNFSFLLDVYAKHFSGNFSLVCFGGGKFLEVELQKISSYNLSHKVFHVEGPDSLLVSLYKSAFCLVYPSLYEGFGIPPLEAMALGCPVLASNVSSIPEVVGDAGILFDPLSEESLVTSIESLYNESKRNEMIKVGFGQERKFSWDRVTEETLEVYKNIS